MQPDSRTIKRFCCLVSGVLFLVGCSNNQPDSEEALVRAIFEAAIEKNDERLESLYAPLSLFVDVLKCSTDSRSSGQTMMRHVDQSLESARRNLFSLEIAETDYEIGIYEEGTERPINDYFSDCTYDELDVTLTENASLGGKQYVAEVNEKFEVELVRLESAIRVDGKWYAIGPVMSGLNAMYIRIASTQIGRLEMAVEQFYLDTGRLPNRLEHLVEEPGDLSNWDGPYAEGNWLIDLWGNPYNYRNPGENNVFNIYTYGKDGQPGGAGVNRDIGD